MAWIKHDYPIPGPHAVVSTNPDAMNAISILNSNVTFGSSTLTRVQEEAIATVVSTTNKCRY